jgi:hypothetical protein
LRIKWRGLNVCTVFILENKIRPHHPKGICFYAQLSVFFQISKNNSFDCGISYILWNLITLYLAFGRKLKMISSNSSVMSTLKRSHRGVIPTSIILPHIPKGEQCSLFVAAETVWNNMIKEFLALCRKGLGGGS